MCVPFDPVVPALGFSGVEKAVCALQLFVAVVTNLSKGPRGRGGQGTYEMRPRTHDGASCFQRC